MITVSELITILTTASSMNDYVYVDNMDENNPVLLESVEKNAYGWGFVIGKVEQ